MKTYLRIAIIVGAIVLVAFAVWKGTAPTASPQPSVELSPSIVPLASVSPFVLSYDPAPADWATYASPGFPFTIKYPSDWIVGSCGPGCTGWASPVAPDQFVFATAKSPGTVDTLLAGAESYIAARETVTAGANTWLKLTLQHPLTGDIVTSHFIERGGFVYSFDTVGGDSDTLAVYAKALRSVVFTK